MKKLKTLLRRIFKFLTRERGSETGENRRRARRLTKKITAELQMYLDLHAYFQCEKALFCKFEKWLIKLLEKEL
jgi:hypothetical protein